jgi:23S rRNA pseudouridine2605 synthase
VTLQRLQKIIARAGVVSRRKAEALIVEGRVRVNGRVVEELGEKADPHADRIEVDGRQLSLEAPVTLLMNKPRGVVCTASDPEGRETVIDLVKDIGARLFPVGRLDFATSGALLLTNDGALSYALTHPKHHVEKTYLLKVAGGVSEEALEKWRTGVDIGDVVTRPAEVFRVEQEESYTWIQVTLHEGRNRQIRRMGEATGIDIRKLKRVSFAGLTIEGLKVGQYRHLTPRELATLKQRYHISSENPKNDRRNRKKKLRKRPRDSDSSAKNLDSFRAAKRRRIR